MVVVKWLERQSHNLEVLKSNLPNVRAFLLFFFYQWQWQIVFYQVPRERCIFAVLSKNHHSCVAWGKAGLNTHRMRNFKRTSGSGTLSRLNESLTVTDSRIVISTSYNGRIMYGYQRIGKSRSTSLCLLWMLRWWRDSNPCTASAPPGEADSRSTSPYRFPDRPPKRPSFPERFRENHLQPVPSCREIWSSFLSDIRETWKVLRRCRRRWASGWRRSLRTSSTTTASRRSTPPAPGRAWLWPLSAPRRKCWRPGRTTTSAEESASARSSHWTEGSGQINNDKVAQVVEDWISKWKLVGSNLGRQLFFCH